MMRWMKRLYLLNSYWQVDKQQVAKLLETMFNGDTVAVVQNSIQKVIPTNNQLTVTVPKMKSQTMWEINKIKKIKK